jgi:orotidine-5'-phosphate decarboxylase
LARALRGHFGLVKVGSQLFTAHGPGAVRQLAKLVPGIFLDLKFHDIPNTVARAVAAAAELPKVRLLTLHALGGAEMMAAARSALAGHKNPPKLLAVTVLTSHDQQCLRQVGIVGTLRERAVKLAELAQESGMDGVVTSAHEVRAIREVCGRDFIILVPGVRPAGAGTQDQTRIATPAEAARAGADYLVIGRPITAAKDPLLVSKQIIQEISEALREPSKLQI